MADILTPEQVAEIRELSREGSKYGNHTASNEMAIRLCDTVDDLREQLREAEEEIADKCEIELQADAKVGHLTDALRGLLLSADASWEERGEGHDWREACEAARRALAEMGESDGND